MALQTEIWITSIIKELFADNSFASKAVDHSGFVNNKTVHVPNAGVSPGVTKNRTELPATISKVVDLDLTYSIDEYTTDPILIPHAETVELSFDKRESVIYSSRMKLNSEVYQGLIYSWLPTAPTKVATMGESVESHLPDATGNRLAMDTKTVKAVKKMFDRQNIPVEDRYMLLDADMYNQLMDSMTEATQVNFLSGADAATGVIGKYMGFQFYMRSQVAKTAGNGTVKAWSATAAATDSAAGIAWSKSCVSRAIGDTVMYEQEKAPAYYGDVVSFLVRTGGSAIRSDKSGVVLIYQATTA